METYGSTRRDWLRLCAAAGAAGIFVTSAGAAETAVPAVAVLDHLLLGVADLEKGIEWVHKATGVKAVVGGSHPGVGTRNALVSLGASRYLEIIGPDPAQKEFQFRIDLRKLSEPRLIAWAAGTTDIDALAKKARSAGFRTFGPRDGSRARPDGKTLRWKTLAVMSDFGRDGIDPIPFFIQWSADSVHPSQDSPKGCELVALEIDDPSPAQLKRALAKLGIDATVKAAERARLRATLRTSSGAVKLD